MEVSLFDGSFAPIKFVLFEFARSRIVAIWHLAAYRHVPILALHWCRLILNPGWPFAAIGDETQILILPRNPAGRIKDSEGITRVHWWNGAAQHACLGIECKLGVISRWQEPLERSWLGCGSPDGLLGLLWPAGKPITAAK